MDLELAVKGWDPVSLSPLTMPPRMKRGFDTLATSGWIYNANMLLMGSIIMTVGLSPFFMVDRRPPRPLHRQL
jgi:hypothetical protein